MASHFSCHAIMMVRLEMRQRGTHTTLGWPLTCWMHVSLSSACITRWLWKELEVGKCPSNIQRQHRSYFHSFADSFDSSSSVPSHTQSLRTPNCLSGPPSVAWPTSQHPYSVVSLSLVSTLKSILHGIQGELSKLRSDCETLLLQTFNAHPLLTA